MAPASQSPDGKAASAVPQSPLPNALQAGSGTFYGMLSTLVVYMVQFYGVAPTPQDVGYYTGIMTAMLNGGRICTTLLWGLFSDLTGRKPSLIAGAVATVAVSLFLAFTDSFLWACVALAVYGVLYNAQLLAKASMGELCDRSNQARGFSLLVFAWGLGLFLGPTLGAILAFPCKDNSTTCPRLLQTHPFLLSFLLLAVGHAAVGVALLFLRESRNLWRERGGEGEGEGWDKVGTEGVGRLESAVEEAGKVGPTEPLLKSPAEVPGTAAPLLTSREEGGDAKHKWHVAAVVSMSGCLYLLQVYADTLFSIMAAAPQSIGGFSYSASTVGYLNAFMGVVILISSLLLVPPLGRRLGALRTVQLGFCLYVPMWQLVPVAALCSSLPALQLGLMVLFKLFRAVVGSITFSGVWMVVCNTANGRNMAFVTSLGDTLGTVFASIGPAVAGVLWREFSWRTFPMHNFIAWIVPSFMSATMFVICLSLPSSLNAPRPTQRR